jgi:hypothetical protein
LVREEEDAYVELLTPEEQMLHATSLSNYAMAAVATLRARGMTDEQWRVSADFDYKAAIPGPCIYLKMHRAGAGSKTVPLVVDGENMGADGRWARMTVGQVKVLIAETQGIPEDQQWIYFGGVLLAAPPSAPESCAEAESLRRTLWQVSESDPGDSDLGHTLEDWAIQVDRGVYSERGRAAFVWTKLLHVVDARNPDRAAMEFLDERTPSSRLAQDAWLACAQVIEMFRLLDGGDGLPGELYKKVWMRKLELERGALGMLYDSVDGKLVVAPTSLPGSFRRFAEWCDKVGWGSTQTPRVV